MRISDWSSDVCSSDLTVRAEGPAAVDEITVRADQPLPDALATIERLMVRRALERADGRFEEAARLLGISRKGLFLKRSRWAVQTRASSEWRRVGTEWVRTCRSRWSPKHLKTKH